MRARDLHRPLAALLGRPSRRGTRAERPSDVNQFYDGAMFNDLLDEYYGHSDFANWGYWKEGTRSQRQACDNLMTELLRFLPETSGRILDVACGKGATTRRLLRHFGDGNVVAINISDKQLERAQHNAPGATFCRMDATRLDFDDASFDAVACVEAAQHFDTREQFLREALRVLKPGGQIILSDILFSWWEESTTKTLSPKNWISDPLAYRRLLERVGFCDVKVRDVTRECFEGHDQFKAQWLRARFEDGEITPGLFLATQLRRKRRQRAVRYYLLASASRPSTTEAQP